MRQLLGMTRLLTLTGAGGCGKTRLAQRIAADVLIAYSEGVWYAELATLTDPELVPEVIARALGLVPSDQPAQERVMDYLRERQVLLVLDNCEHIDRRRRVFCRDIARLPAGDNSNDQPGGVERRGRDRLACAAHAAGRGRPAFC